MAEPSAELGRYQILGEIGRGSSGVVYHARDTLLGREVALKGFRPPPTATEEEAEELRGELLREARSAGMLSHPDVVTIYDVLEGADGTLYIAMEYVDGRSLSDVLSEAGRLDFERAVDLVSHIASALDYLHAMGVVHRDVKPANILITRGGRVKITDFGIALPGRAEPADDGGMVLGTPSYMAPEQILGREISARTDVWSLGVVLYEMLTGRRPFDGRNVAEIVHRVVHAPVPGLQEEHPHLPDLQNVVERALAKDPRWRFASAGELARELRRILYHAAGEAGKDLSDTGMLDRTLVSQRVPARGRRASIRRAGVIAAAAGVLALLAYLVAGGIARTTESSGGVGAVADLDERSLEAFRLLQEGNRLLASGDAEGAALFFEVVERLEHGLPEAERIAQMRREAEAEARRRAPEVDRVRSELLARDDRELVASARRHLVPGGDDSREARRALDRAGESLAGAEGAHGGAAGDGAVRVEFSSEVPQGVLTIYGGGEQLLRRGFSYYEPGWLFGRTPATGSFEEELEVPEGVDVLWIYVARPESAARRLEVPAPGEGHRVLRIHLPAEGDATAVWR